MNHPPRPSDAAPGGMRGSSRMHDPTEAQHDRVRRWSLNAAFFVVLALNLAQWRWIGLRGMDWASVTLLVIAAMPLGVSVKVFELRFKMAKRERDRVLRELPLKTKIAFVSYSLLAVIVFFLNAPRLTWALAGIWLYDFVTYYRTRPERIRHLYAVTKTLDELRGFRAPWVWPVPALAFELARLHWG